jgi:tRNA(Ile)-lysidine synthase
MRLSLMNEPISIRYRHGGERCRPAPTGHEQALKKLLQGWGVPPWLRERVPLVFVGEELAAVADLCICAPFHSAPGELGVAIRWQRGPGFSV